MLSTQVNETMINLKQGERTSKWENDQHTINAQEARGVVMKDQWKTREQKNDIGSWDDGCKWGREKWFALALNPTLAYALPSKKYRSV
jgi:hypothetical protein